MGTIKRNYSMVSRTDVNKWRSDETKDQLWDIMKEMVEYGQANWTSHIGGWTVSKTSDGYESRIVWDSVEKAFGSMELFKDYPHKDKLPLFEDPAKGQESTSCVWTSTEAMPAEHQEMIKKRKP